jgi:hypothetical protein
MDGRASRVRAVIIVLTLILFVVPVLAFLAFGTHAMPRR